MAILSAQRRKPSGAIAELQRALEKTRARRETIAKARQASAKNLVVARDARREALLEGVENRAADRSITESTAKVEAHDDALVQLDGEIAELEKQLAAAVALANRRSVAAAKREQADAIEATRRDFHRSMQAYAAVLAGCSNLTEGPGLAETLRNFVQIEARALPGLLQELRYHASMLADESVSARQLMMNGAIPFDPKLRPPDVVVDQVSKPSGQFRFGPGQHPETEGEHLTYDTSTTPGAKTKPAPQREDFVTATINEPERIGPPRKLSIDPRRE